MKVTGDLTVQRTAEARSYKFGLSKETLTTSRTIDVNDYQQLHLTAAAGQDVILPNANNLTAGWNRVFSVADDSVGSISVKTYHVATPALLKSLASGKAIKVTLLDATTTAGEWKVQVISDSETAAAERYVYGFTATTEWGAASAGYYTITVAAVTHGIGTNPVVSVQELTGSDFIKVEADQLKIFANGDVSIRVPETPNLRFAGRLVIS